MESMIVVAVFVALVIITITLGVRIVPQGTKHVVQRLGKYHKTLGPGLNIILPYLDRVAYKVTTKDIVLDIPSQDVITRDNAVIIANAVAYINIISPEKSVYGVEDYRVAIQTLVQTSLRSIIGEMALDDALSSRDQIKAKLKESISDDIADWGITLKTVEIQDINPSESIQGGFDDVLTAFGCGDRVVVGDGLAAGLDESLLHRHVVKTILPRPEILLPRDPIDRGLLARGRPRPSGSVRWHSAP